MRFSKGRWQSVENPVLILTSLAARTYTGVFNPERKDMAGKTCQGTTCSGWNIGEPAAAKIGGWFVLAIDSQTCSQAQRYQQHGIFFAVSRHLDRGWKIVSEFQGAPGTGTPPYAFPRFAQASDGQWLMYYLDEAKAQYVVKVKVSRQGKVLATNPHGKEARPALPTQSAASMHSFFDPRQQKYYAITDNYGAGKFEAMTKLWLVGPSETPYVFDWSSRRPLLQTGGRYSGAIRFPQMLARQSAESSVFFFGKENTEHFESCSAKCSQTIGVAAGFAIHPASELRGKSN